MSQENVHRRIERGREIPVAVDAVVNLASDRRQLARLSWPFLLLALMGIAYAFSSPSAVVNHDAWWALVLLALAVFSLGLPRSFVAGHANVLIPLLATISAVLAMQDPASYEVGASLFIFAPVMWAALFLKPWKSYVVLATSVVAQLVMSINSSSPHDPFLWKRILFSAALGTLMVYAIQELRRRLRLALVESDRANSHLRDALARSTQLDHALRNVSQGIYITDATQPSNPVVFVSPGFERMTGYTCDELMERGVSVLVGAQTNEDVLAELQRCEAEHEDCLVELVHYRKDGSTFWVSRGVSYVRDDDDRVTRTVSIYTDVTTRRELEERLLQSQKMEVVGTIAAGMAHDFNNSLLVIRGYNDLVAKLAKESKVQEITRRIDDAVFQASEVTHRLLAYGRAQESRPTTVDVNELLRETISLWGRLLGDKVRVELSLGEDLPPIEVDPAQMAQGVVNLIINARDAMVHGGVLTISTSRSERPPSSAIGSEARIATPEPSNGWVHIEVRDTGVGMNEETRLQIFEPFFTTKAHGTGLGLPTVENLVRSSGGVIDVRSQLAVGTVFHLYLPATATNLIPPTAVVQPDLTATRDVTVLVVEDSQIARELLVDALREHEFEVIAAEDGVIALATLAEHAGPLHVLVTDIDMPEMGGAELARRLLVTHPALRILFVSGYSVSEIIYEDDFVGRAAFLPKPYRTSDLLHALHELVTSF